MARVNINILGNWNGTGMGEYNSDNHYVYCYRQESLRRNEVTLTVNKRVWNAILGCSLKNNRMILVRFQGKPYSITAIQVCAPTSNAEEADAERFLWRPTRASRMNTKKKRCPFQRGGLECKSRISRETWRNKQVWRWSTKWSSTKTNRVRQENEVVIANTLFQQPKKQLYTWTSSDGQNRNHTDIFFAVEDGEAL